MNRSWNIYQFLLVACILVCVFVSSVAAGEMQDSADNATQVPVLQDSVAKTTPLTQDIPVSTRPANMAPVNPAYLRYMEQQQQTAGGLDALDSFTVSSGIPISSHATGAIPLYEDLSHLKGTYVVDDTGLPSPEKPMLHTALPAKYDLRANGKVSPVKNQGTAGVCWAFATVASLESTLLPGEVWDFSENNMKNLLSDLYPQGFTRNFTAGADHKESTAYLVRWTGPVNQSDDPYNATSPYSPPNLTVQKHVQRVDYVPNRVNSTDNDNIKNAVYSSGALYTTYNMSDNTTLPYWNDTFNSYYYFGDAGLNHAVAIVGWDDTWSRNNFSTVPPIDGAFIIKNSWGSGWGDGGFFYCSYNDTLIGKDNALFLSSPPKNYDHIFQYDPLGWVSSLYTADAKIGWAANVFNSTRSQNLSAVSFYTTDTNASYQAWVYVNPNDGPVLNSSGAVFTQSGTFANAGYHTIAIPKEIPLDANDRFAVAVKLINPEYNWSIAYQDWTYRTTNAKAYPEQGYISNTGTAWGDVTEQVGFKNASICIKAFTRDTHITGLVANFTGTPTSGTAPLTVQFTDTSTGSPTGWTYFFGDENYTAPWTQVNASAGWSARFSHSSVAMPDGSIVLMGGTGGGNKNDVWRSIDDGTTWTRMTAGAGWSARSSHSSVAMPDSSIVLMGGYINSPQNDVWRSTDNGATWTQLPNAGWSARWDHSSVAMPDGSIVLMGGLDTSFNKKNDVWRSTDNGATWTQVNASPGWSARYGHTSVVMPDGSIVLMGGYSGGFEKDVWRSTDNGVTWMRMTASAGWSGRYRHTSVAMPDGSIVLMGGADGHMRNDVWRSTDNGATWTQVNASAGWSARSRYTSVAMQDGSVVVMGGQAEYGEANNNVWRFVPTGSSLQSPSHTYTAAGLYSVTLTATNAKGSNTKTKIGYITVTEPSAPVANFTGTPTSGTTPLTVQFTDTSTGSPTGWAYFFGDENYTAPWTQVNASAGWSVRFGHSSVAMPDGTIVLMGGYGGDSYKNDVWRSTDNGVTWTVVNASAGWTVRYSHTSVVMPDGSIVLMGGKIGNSPYFINDVWRSTDKGATWTQMNASAGWAGRFSHSSVAMPDGSIVLMGGNRNSFLNDVWRSTDNGATWTQVNASAGWAARWGHSSVVMPDGSIVLTGGQKSSSPNWVNDVWRSTDNGAMWTQMNASAGWAGRVSHSSVAMPDGSIVLLGGESPSSPYWLHDVWRSTDNGATWTVVNASAGWAGRYCHSSVAMPDGSIVLLGGRIDGGLNYKNDVWRFVPTGSSLQNPSHTYTAAGLYSVTLTATNAKGSNTTTKTGYIVVTGSPADRARLILPAASLYQNTATKIPIRVANIAGGTGISFNLTYDPSVIRVNEITLNQSYISSSNLDVNSTPGLIRLALTRTEPITIGSPVPLFFLNTTGTGLVGASTLLNFSHATWSTPTFDSQPMDTVNGSILIYRIRGDLNGNGWVDIGDTAKTAYMVVKLTPDLIPDADFNNNGVIDTGDASKIAYYLVGRVPTL